MATSDQIIADAIPEDEIWGTGLMSGLTSIPREWKGANVLGWALMEVRSHVRVAARSPVRSSVGSGFLAHHFESCLSQHYFESGLSPHHCESGLSPHQLNLET